MKRTLIAAALCLATLAGCATQQSVVQSCAAKGQLNLILVVDTPQVHVNSFAKIRVFLKNGSDRTYHLVQPGDGSDAGWRTPTIKWYVDGARQDVDYRNDPSITPLTLGELFDIAPGARVELNSWVGGVYLREVGNHDVALQYQNDPGLTWLGTTGSDHHDPEAMKKVRASDKVDLMSCRQMVSVVQ